MRKRGDSHENDRFAGESPREVRDDEFGETMDLESALIHRLRTMEWPKPTEEQRERCLRKIMEKMAEKEEKEKQEKAAKEAKEAEAGERAEATRFEAKALRAERYPLTRRAVDDNRYSSTRRAPELRQQPYLALRNSVRQNRNF